MFSSDYVAGVGSVRAAMKLLQPQPSWKWPRSAAESPGQASPGCLGADPATPALPLHRWERFTFTQATTNLCVTQEAALRQKNLIYIGENNFSKPMSWPAAALEETQDHTCYQGAQTIEWAQVTSKEQPGAESV